MRQSFVKSPRTFTFVPFSVVKVWCRRSSSWWMSLTMSVALSFSSRPSSLRIAFIML